MGKSITAASTPARKRWPKRRPIQRGWIDGLRSECDAAGVAFFFKQWGGASATAGGCELDGAEFKGWPCAA